MPSTDWDSLTDEQREGMSREFWEDLPEANRAAFLARDCIEGDGMPRVMGSPYCARHVQIHQEDWRNANG